MEETLRVLVAFGFGLLLIMLRLDAERFRGVAGVSPARTADRLVARRRFAWYAMGIALIAAILVVYQGRTASSASTGARRSWRFASGSVR